MLIVLVVCSLFIHLNVNALRFLPDQHDHSAGSTWLTRSSGAYHIMTNDSITNVVTTKDVSFVSVDKRIRSLVDRNRYDRDTMLLRQYWHSLNTSFFYGQDESHAHPSETLKLNNFYLHHAQCRQCVRYNMDLIGATGRYQSSDDPLDIPSYAPARMMKWCAFDWSRRGTNESISELGHVLSDDEGYCVDADTACPGVSVDLGIYDQSSCHHDDAQDKQSCELCVLDDYGWLSHKKSGHVLDSYDGSCLPQNIWMPLIYDPSRRMISSLDECPDRQSRC